MRSMQSFPRYVFLFYPTTNPRPPSPSRSFSITRMLIHHHNKQILTSQIRSEIASSSERAYPNLPISSTKSLLFLDSEGAVIDFARSRGWVLKDGMIYFPKDQPEVVDSEDAVASSSKEEMSKLVIENALGYARELETIV